MSRYIICEHEQGTEGWHLDRLGKVTGSNVENVFAKLKTGEAAGRANYRMDLVLERITGKPAEPDFKKTRDMLWGNEQEPFARMAAEISSGHVQSSDPMAVIMVAAASGMKGRDRIA